MNVPPETLVLIAARRAAGAPWEQIEVEFSMSHNTARRKLKEAGFSSEKGERENKDEKIWTRPCLRCKSEERRSKFLFFCKACRFENAESGIPGWMTGVTSHAG